MGRQVSYTSVRQAEYMTLQAAASYLGLSEKTVRKRVRDGRLAGYRSGPFGNSHILVRRSDLDEMLQPVTVV